MPLWFGCDVGLSVDALLLKYGRKLSVNWFAVAGLTVPVLLLRCGALLLLYLIAEYPLDAFVFLVKVGS